MTAPAAVRFAVDPWDAGYAGISETGLSAALEESTAPLNLDVEVPAAEWKPIGRRVEPSCCVQFIDGVRRIEARVWFLGDAGTGDPGIAASYAAGLVTCDGSAVIRSTVVERGLFTASPRAADVRTPCGEEFLVRMAASSEVEVLTAAMQERMRAVEIAVATAARDEFGRDDDLLVVDGPLRGRENLPRTIGYIKTHQSAYLPPEAHQVVARLQPGERTPVFTLGSHWSRHTWYLRLPCRLAHPWEGVVRVECSADVGPAEGVALADLSAATLPLYASTGHKDGRAPQNLYPIGALERQLRHRLGDRLYLYRELSRAART